MIFFSTFSLRIALIFVRDWLYSLSLKTLHDLYKSTFTVSIYWCKAHFDISWKCYAYGRYGDRIKQYEVFLLEMFNDILKLDQLHWFPNQTSQILWPWYKPSHLPNCECFSWSACNGCDEISTLLQSIDSFKKATNSFEKKINNQIRWKERKKTNQS